MKANISSADKVVRVILAIVVAVLYFNGVISGTLAIILGVLAAILMVTVVINFCPVYQLLGISTRNKSFNQKIK